MKDKRLKEMENYIFEHKSVTLKELCDIFHISLNTVRRYINELTENPSIKKIYGGVCIQPSDEKLTPFYERDMKSKDSKQYIAERAATYICDKDIIYIDSGTTTKEILNFVPDELQITVITNSNHIIQSAIAKPQVTLLTLPGILNRKTLSFTGDDTSRFIDKLNINKAFMACTGISLHSGATNSSPDEYYIKRAAIKNANTIFVLADHTKFGVSTLMTYCAYERIDYLITDTMPNDNFIRGAQSAGNRIIY